MCLLYVSVSSSSSSSSSSSFSSWDWDVDLSHLMDPLSDVLLQPLLHNWRKKAKTE